MREIRKDLPRFCGRQIAISVNSQVAETLLGPARKALAELSEELGREIEVRARPSLHQEQFEVTALDEGPPVVIPLRWLDEKKPEEEAPAEAEDLEAASDSEEVTPGEAVSTSDAAAGAAALATASALASAATGSRSRGGRGGRRRQDPLRAPRLRKRRWKP